MLEKNKINIQLFAEGDEVSEGKLQNEEGQNDEIIDDENQQEEGKQEETVLEHEKEDRVPLATLLEEKKKRKELEKKLREIEDSKLDNDLQTRQQKIIDKYIKMGIDETVARAIAEDHVETLKETRTSTVKKTQDDYIDEEIKDLADLPGFKDASKYTDQIKANMKKYKGMTAEESFRLVKPSFMRESEIRTDAELKAGLARRNAEGKKQPAATPSSPSNPYPLDENDKKALEGLQKAQPDGGWTAEKFYKIMKG